MSGLELLLEAAPVLGGGVLGALSSILLGRRKASAQADAIIIQNAASLTGMLQKELARLSERVHSMEKDNQLLHLEIARLSAENMLLQTKIYNAEKAEVEEEREPADRPDTGTGS